MTEHQELPQWHPGAQIRPGHPEDAAIQIDPNWQKRWEKIQENRLPRKGK